MRWAVALMVIPICTSAMGSEDPEPPSSSCTVGRSEGAGVGEGIGKAVGKAVGEGIGKAVGAGIGTDVGAGIGAAVGTDVGAGVGTAVGIGMHTEGESLEHMPLVQSLSLLQVSPRSHTGQKSPPQSTSDSSISLLITPFVHKIDVGEGVVGTGDGSGVGEDDGRGVGTGIGAGDGNGVGCLVGTLTGGRVSHPPP